MIPVPEKVQTLAFEFVDDANSSLSFDDEEIKYCWIHSDLVEDVQALLMRTLKSVDYNVYRVEKFLTPALDPESKTDGLSNPKTKELLMSIILEEVFELAQGLGSDAVKAFFTKTGDLFSDYKYDSTPTEANLVEVLDALVDIVVVTHNATVRCGMQNVFAPAFEIIMDNNMRKINLTHDEAVELQQQHPGSTIVESDGFYHVKNVFGKILKKSGGNEIAVKYKLAQLLTQ